MSQIPLSFLIANKSGNSPPLLSSQSPPHSRPRPRKQNRKPTELQINRVHFGVGVFQLVLGLIMRWVWSTHSATRASKAPGKLIIQLWQNTNTALRCSTLWTPSIMVCHTPPPPNQPPVLHNPPPPASFHTPLTPTRPPISLARSDSGGGMVMELAVDKWWIIAAGSMRKCLDKRMWEDRVNY